MNGNNSFIRIDIISRRIYCLGDWKVDNVSQLMHEINTLSNLPSKGELTISGKQITHVDSSGAWSLRLLRQKLTSLGFQTRFIDFSKEQLKLIELINKQLSQKIPIPPSDKKSWLARFGKNAIENISGLKDFLHFVGELTYEFLNIIRHPRKFRLNDLSGIIEKSGYQALPIIALISLMIGVVLAHQMGLQLKNYGANIFIVDFLGYAGLREFGPLITAIMVAGRTGSAFTAQLGTMKINQEIDALDTMGITPGELLILPRLAGLFISLPLLAVWADIFCIIGGMIIASSLLNITWQEFLMRFQHQIPIRYFLIGIGKAPIFALIIAGVGCFQGINVEGSADSVGKKTTKSVVLAIFFIIVADALFSILLSRFNL